MKGISKFIHSMGHLYMILLLFIFFVIGGTGQAWGATMTARLNTSVSPSGSGTAYVAAHGEAMGTSTSKSQTGSSSESKYFDVIAIANRGYKLKNLSLGSGSWLCSDPNFVAADLTTGLGTSVTTNEAIVKHTTGSAAYIAATNTATVTATFESAGAAFNVQYKEADNGNYTIVGPSGTPAYGSPVEGDGVTYSTYSGDNIKLTATPAAGYTFIRYYTIDGAGNIKTLGTLYQTEQQIVNIKDLANYSGTVYVCAEFSNQPFAIGERTFETLDAAIQAVQSSTNKTILVIGDATVQAGHYTLPSNAVLLVPKRLGHTAQTSLNNSRTLDLTPTPSLYRKLTFADGVNLIVNGTIEVGGTQSSGAQGMTGAGIPVGSYGQIEMQQGSSMTLNNNAKLYAYGFITGEGTIDARRGSKVYEQFQMYDWKGGSHASGFLNNSEKVFPINQYYIQNVEVATTYHPGAALIGFTSIAVTSVDYFALSKTTISINCDNIGVIGVKGTSSMFLMDEADMSEDTWVRKRYDVATDRQVYEVNSSAELGSMQINLSGVPILGDLDFDTKNYTLPVTNNLKIHILDGKMDIKYSTVLLSGAEIEIDKTATVAIESGRALYLYDAAQWGTYVYSGVYAQQVKYTPSHNGKPNKRPEAGSSTVKPASAALNVHGTFDVKGALYTTAGGANIYSSIADAGTVYFSTDAAGNGNVSQPSAYTVNTLDLGIAELPQASTITYATAACTSAQLKNDAGSDYSDGDGYSETAGTPSGKSWCFIDINNDSKGEWVRLTTDGCFVLDEETGIYYAKPSDYVALQNGKTPNPDHTYSSADGTRTLILICDDQQTDCQWWEVTYHAESGLYYCDKNGIYYFYDEDINVWVEKTYIISWLNYDGTLLKDEYNADITYLVPYGSTPKYNNSTPTRPDDVGYYTYDFVGWTPAFTPVTEDVSYTAVYERNPVMYTITWNNANGTEREVDYFQRDEMPVCRTEPAGMGTSWEWTPVVEPVTGNATYTLHALETPKTSFTVTWKNFNGTVLQTLETDENVPAGTIPTYNGTTPAKTSLDDVKFIWNKNDGWTPTISPVTADIVYMAKYTEQPITYAITWKNGEETLLVQNVSPNTVPQYTGATPTKPSSATYHYTFSGWSPTVVAATGDETYTAQFAETPVDKVVDSNETIEEGKQQTVTNLTIETTGKLVIPTTSRINATNLYLEATSDASGQLITNANTSINITGNAYFDLTLNTESRTWNAFGVPWPIGNLDDVKLIADGQPMTLGRDYEIVYYNGATRASQGAGAHCWEYVVDHGKTLTPGQGYMIAFGRAVNTVRFTKAADSPVLFNGFLSVAENGGGETANNGWNAIANPMAYHVTMNAGPTVGYVHNGGVIGSDGYVPYDINDKKYVVGKMVYVQVGGSQSVVINPAGDKGAITPASAPVRRSQAAYKQYLALDDYYQIDIADANAQGGRVYVLPEEDKADEYVIGHDLSHLGISDQKAQIWVFRYGTKLALNTTAPVEGVAEYALRVYAPKNGEYTISNIQAPMADEEYVVYLTRDGEAIWNLSESAYTADLTSGVHKEYGLRLSARKSPAVVTGVDEAVVDAKGETRKVLINNQVFIIRGNEVYTIDGQLVK